MKFAPHRLSHAAAPLMLAMVACGFVQAQTDEKIEMQELKTTLQISATQIQDLEGRLAKAKEQVNALTESLASSNGDGQQARENYEKLCIQMEGLGIAVLDKSDSGLQQRLLTALSDLRISKQQCDALSEALINLSEASLAFTRTATGDSAGKENLDKALAATEKALGAARKGVEPAADGGDLHNAQIVSLKDDLGIAVLNVGSRHGVHPGMPFSIYRQDKPIARALVVDVRQGICGAVVRDLVSKDEPVKVGDTGRVETSKG